MNTEKKACKENTDKDEDMEKMKKIMDSLYKKELQQRRKRHKEDEYDEQI